MAIETVNILSTGQVNVVEDDVALMTTVDDALLPTDYASKLSTIHTAMQSAGQSEIHCERRPFKSFEHVVKGADVTENNLGTTISLTDFNYLMDNRAAAITAIENPPDPE